ncbi:hypothetical protein P7K49_022006 [Saguinus oedipus]|uniref:Uncharacterized protein n=1 Tax=Saguinus oedipus TaxID=9490 RepID=A0ABQ9UW13_SAGOE|nr:hypothetical protein P7K49_022006 [Saguinus oedipus]
MPHHSKTVINAVVSVLDDDLAPAVPGGWQLDEKVPRLTPHGCFDFWKSWAAIFATATAARIPGAAGHNHNGLSIVLFSGKRQSDQVLLTSDLCKASQMRASAGKANGLKHRQLLELASKSLGARYLWLHSLQSLLGQGKAICSRIRFPGPVTLSPPNSCQKASHMPGECLRSLGS